MFRCDVYQAASGSFDVRCSPRIPTAGLHQLRVQVGRADIFATPLNVEVMPRRAGQTFTDLSSRPKIPNAIGLSTISRVDKADAIFATFCYNEVTVSRDG